MRRFSTGYLSLFMLLVLFAGRSFAATYYVDFASGNDASAGTSKTAPWKHAPGMQGCTGTCAAATVKPGDSLIFKGGVTWDHTCWAWVIPFSGTSANPIYVGVDQTWYAGSAWSQPVFDGQTYAATGATDGSMIRNQTSSYITYDNFEMKNLYITSPGGPAFVHADGAAGVSVKNSYLHGWTVPSSITKDDAHGGVYFINGGGTVSHTTISDVEQEAVRNSGVAIFGADMVDHVTVHDVATACLGCVTVHDSTFYDISYPDHDFDLSYHTNGIYEIESGSVYNNLIYNFNANAGAIYPNACSGGSGPSQDWTQYVYNNVIWTGSGLTSGTPIIDVSPEVAQGSGSCGTVYIFHNTIQSSGNVVAIRSAPWPTGQGQWIIKNLTVQNNQIINADGSNQTCFTGQSCDAASLVNDHNYFQSNSTASANGYTMNTGPSSAPTSMKGVDLSGLQIPTLNVDRLAVARAPAWNAGAYAFGTSNVPAAPNGLTAAVQ